MVASVPDLLRLVVIPVFAWAAWRDIKTRRLSDRFWAVLTGLGLVLLLWELIQLAPFNSPESQFFFIRLFLSLAFVGLLGVAFWWFRLFGEADAKAMIALSILLPVYPSYNIAGLSLPLVGTPIDVFSITIITNAALLASLLPVVVGISNFARKEIDPIVMFLARPVSIKSLPHRHGWLSETPSGTTIKALDLDALRMYLRWRGLTIEQLRSAPEIARDPSSIGETDKPSDGRTDIDADLDWGNSSTSSLNSTNNEPDVDSDPWGAEQFLDSIEKSAYGTSPEQLREGLELLAMNERDVVWVSPGLPFVVAMFIGLLVAFTYGDLLHGFVGWLGFGFV